MRMHYTKNAQSALGSFVWAIPVGRPELSFTNLAGQWHARLEARGVVFTGKGESVVLANQDLMETISKAAVKRERRGRPTDRCRIAVSLLRGDSLH